MSPQETVQSFYKALGEGNAPAALGVLSPTHLAWTEATGFPYYSGTWTTVEQVRDNLLMKLATEWEGFAATPHQFFTAGDEVVSLGFYTGKYKATGKSVKAAFAHHWRVQNGHITMFAMYTDTLLFDQAIHNK